MAEKRKMNLAKRIVLICISAIVLLVLAYLGYYVYVVNFQCNDPVFVGDPEFKTEMTITDKDMTAVTTILKENHSRYWVNSNRSGIFVQQPKWETASYLLENSGIEFDGFNII